VGRAGENRRYALGDLTSIDDIAKAVGCTHSLWSVKENNLTVGTSDVIKWLQTYDQVITENKDYLTELDSIIGDADHGANMHRGFQAVMTKLPGVQDKILVRSSKPSA
jgi:hypothetical protein